MTLPNETLEISWFDVDEYMPPRGVNILLLTLTGSPIIGHYEKNAGFVGWLPIPKRPPGMQLKIQALRGY